jgi:acyl-CoA thioesterase I
MTTMRKPRLLLAGLFAWLVIAASTALAEEPACVLPEEFIAANQSLSSVKAAIDAGGPVRILAVGSATTVAQEAGPKSSFPFQMAAALHRILPKIEFPIVAVGGRGLTAADMLPLIEQSLRSNNRPSLVLWQTGTVDAVRGVRPEDISETLQAGAASAADAGADLILIDFQYSRFLRANADLDPYEAALGQVAALTHVALFRRFDLMHFWADEGTIDLERAEAADRAKVLNALHRCLGLALAKFVLNGTGISPAKP